MPKFVIHEIEAIKGKQEFFEVEINGIKQLGAFESELKDTTYISELRTILTYMEYVANNRTLPHTKFKDITPAKEKVKE